MTYGEKLFYVVANGTAATFAYDRLAVHRKAAHKQMERIVDELAALNHLSLLEPKQGASLEEMRAYIREGIIRVQPLLYEVHFYFVAWANCRNYARNSCQPARIARSQKGI